MRGAGERDRRSSKLRQGPIGQTWEQHLWKFAKKGPAVLLGTAGLKRAHRNRIWEEYPSNRMRRENNKTFHHQE